MCSRISFPSGELINITKSFLSYHKNKRKRNQLLKINDNFPTNCTINRMTETQKQATSALEARARVHVTSHHTVLSNDLGCQCIRP